MAWIMQYIQADDDLLRMIATTVLVFFVAVALLVLIDLGLSWYRALRRRQRREAVTDHELKMIANLFEDLLEKLQNDKLISKKTARRWLAKFRRAFPELRKDMGYTPKKLPRLYMEKLKDMWKASRSEAKPTLPDAGQKYEPKPEKLSRLVRKTQEK